MTLRVCSLVALSAAAFAQSFDVASVKRIANPELAYGNERIVVHPGSVLMSNVRVRTAIKWAYEIKEFQITGSGALDAPYDYRNSARYEIAGKAAPDTPISELRLMLRNLLAERFHLAAHRESREVASLVLRLGGEPHKMRPPTDPEGVFVLVPSPTGMTVENGTLDEFGDTISGKLRMPVLNRTGLTGRFNFGLDFSHILPPAEDEYVFSKTIREQMGLAMSREKAAIEMLVVDRVEKRPTEN